MGYSYKILKPKDHTYFDLGKGEYNGPLEEFAEWNGKEIMANAKTSEEHQLAAKMDFNRKMMTTHVEEFIELYMAGLKDGYTFDTADKEYVIDLAKKLWDWLGEDDVWLYGEDVFDYLPRSEWKETGTRYTS